MHKNKTIIYAAFFSVALLVFALSFLLNLLWFGLYDILRERLSVSYLGASTIISGFTWFFVMVRMISKMKIDE
jgi:hypothetical protein